MRSARFVAACVVLAAATGCTVVQREPEPAPSPARRPAPRHALNVPPGHYPPPGSCRVWVPGTPPGRQAKPQSCKGIERDAPAGSLILYRPERNRKVVYVREVHERRRGVVVAVRVYDAKSGAYLRDG